MLRKLEYLPCIPTRGTEVPAGPDWFHEIKHDGYRLILQREGKRVRLFTRRGYDWSDRYPLIVEAAHSLRVKSRSEIWHLKRARRMPESKRKAAPGVTPCGSFLRLPVPTPVPPARAKPSRPSASETLFSS